jgi:hypothetical protein
MRGNADVVGHRGLQIFKVPFVVRIADFLEPILRLLDQNVFGFLMPDVDLDFALADWPFPGCCRRQRIHEGRITVMDII